MSTPSLAVPAAVRAAPAQSMWLVLAAILIADALDLMDSTLTTIAAPSIAASLGGGELLIKWLGSAYALALGSLLVIGGRLGDRFGQRRTFLIGMAGFTAASAVCGFAPGSSVLIAGRLLQGGFGALLIPQGMAIMTQTFSRDQLAKAFSAFGPMLGLAAVAGPLLGAFILDANLGGLGWRPMFLINIVLGSAGLILAWNVLPRRDGDRSVVLDGTGSALLAASMLLLIYGLIEGSSSGWQPLHLATLFAGTACFGVFALRQATAANPLIRPSLLRNRGFNAGLVIGLAFFATVSGLGYVVSIFLQRGLGWTPVEAAIQGIAPMSIGIIVASFACAPLIGRFGRRLVAAGFAVTLAGIIAVGAVIQWQGTAMGEWALLGPIFVVGLGMGSCFGSLFDIALGDVNPAEAGSASGSLSAVQQLAAAIGSATITSILFANLSHGFVPSTLACLVVVAAITVGCLALVRLLPRTAAEETAH